MGNAAYKLNEITIGCIHAGADTFGADQTYIWFKERGEAAAPVNQRTGELFSLDSGDIGHMVDGGTSSINLTSYFFNSNPMTIQLFDNDQDDPFGGLDDLLLSATLIHTGNEPFRTPMHYVSTTQSNSGSTYNIEFTMTRQVELIPRGKAASQAGGLLNGENTDGTLIGKSGKDIINGNDGDDILVGGGNSDILNGGEGSDILFGGKGNDTLSGGASNDIFVVAANNGLDIIKGFHTGDLLGLSSSLKFSDLTLLNQAKGTLVKAGNEKLAFLQGVHQLGVSDFTQIDLANLDSRVSHDFAAISKAANR